MSLILASLILFVPQHPAPAAAPAPANAAYRVVRTFAIGGDGSWDYVAVDGEARRLYVPRSSHVLVLDADSGKQVGEIADTQGVHGVALAPALGRGFTSNGRANTVTVFDSKTLAVVKVVPTGKNPDAITYEPTSKTVWTGCGSSKELTVIDADKLEVVATIAVGGKPEALAFDGKGKLFVNIEDTSEVLRINVATHKVEQRMSVAPGEEPSGLAIDAEHGTLFSVCGNGVMVVLDAATGKVLAKPAIGKRVDGAAFDAATGCALASCGDGTLSVVGTRGATPFTVVQTLPTAVGARTLVLDPKSHQVYLPTAEFAAAPANGGGGRRPAMKPNSFQIVVVGV